MTSIKEQKIIGTKWMVTQPGTTLPDKTFEFCSNGILKYGGMNSRWEIKNGIITISHNNGYAILKGKINDNVFEGTASNKVGKKWTFKGELISEFTSIKEDEIIGTKWMVTQPGSTLPDKTFEFCSNGILKYGGTNSRWEIKNGIITISHNNGYAILKGKINDNVFEGTASNKVGDKWTFKGELISDLKSITEEEVNGKKFMVTQSHPSIQDNTFEFCSDGLLKYNNINTKWEIKEGYIIISHNNGYAILKGKINDNVFEGTASNRVGDKWTFKGELISESDTQNETINASLSKENKLIDKIFTTIRDYRADENREDNLITPDRIETWISQFEVDLRIPILTELDNILIKRYCSKAKVREFLDQVIQVFTKDFSFNDPVEFLKNTDFLSLQPEGKSQQIMLSLLDDLIQEKYGFPLANCGKISKKYSIYMDDILCTGLTLISDIKEWSEKEFTKGKTNKEAVSDSSTILVFAYVFIHNKNYFKKRAEMRFKISDAVSNNHKMYRMYCIENDTSPSSKIDLAYPIEDGQPQKVVDYRNEIIELVDNHTKQYNKESPEEFYRPSAFPANEEFFTNAENRIIVENAFLHKGIEILQNSNANNRNMRALGYSIPSLKNFGFGALCFTWRNVPNNAPLVFWYSGGGFMPLFKAHRGG